MAKSEINGNDERYHGRGQSESSMTDLIECFTYPDATILYPFCGGGTTGVVAIKMKRKFIGVDIKERNISITKSRIQEMTNDMSN